MNSMAFVVSPWHRGNSVMIVNQKSVPVFFAAFAVFGGDVKAQSLIVGIPSTDTTRPGVTMIAHESQVNTWSYPKPYWNSFTFATRGVSENVEVAATLYGLSRPSSGPLVVAAGYKMRVPLAEGSLWEPTLASGQFLAASLNGTSIGGWGFGVGSLRLPELNTRFTLGLATGTAQVFGRPVATVIAGIEQPFSKQWSFVADWMSGDHALAALITAAQWTPTHGFVIIAGPKFPNTPAAGPTAAMVEVTLEF